MSANKEMACAKHAGCKDLFKGPSLTMIICGPTEKQNKQNLRDVISLGEELFSYHTRADIGAAKDHG